MMSTKSFVSGIVLGIAVGYATQKLLTQQYSLSSDKILHLVKSDLKTQGAISGSWINMQKEDYQINNSPIQVYRGGITQDIEGQSQTMEFLADCKTGKIMEIIPV